MISSKKSARQILLTLPVVAGSTEGCGLLYLLTQQLSVTSKADAAQKVVLQGKKKLKSKRNSTCWL